jgi:hypothetical protein
MHVCAEGFLTEATHSYNQMYAQCAQANKTLLKTQLFIGDSLTCDTTDDSLQVLLNMLLQLAESHSQAVHDIAEWKRIDSKKAVKQQAPKYTKRASRINPEEESSDIMVEGNFCYHDGMMHSRKNSIDGDNYGTGGGQSEMLRQMKSQMSKLRRRDIESKNQIEEEVVSMLGEGDSECDELL